MHCPLALDFVTLNLASHQSKNPISLAHHYHSRDIKRNEVLRLKDFIRLIGFGVAHFLGHTDSVFNTADSSIFTPQLRTSFNACFHGSVNHVVGYFRIFVLRRGYRFTG